MSTPAMVPLIGPNGEIGDVPEDRVGEALQRPGYQRGVEVQHPGTGARGVVPLSRLPDALNGGMVPYRASSGVPVPPGMSGNSPVMAPTLGSAPGEVMSTIASHARNLVTAPYHAVMDGPQNPNEQSVVNAGGGGVVGRAGLAADRLMGVSASQMSATDALNQIKTLNSQGTAQAVLSQLKARHYQDAAQSAMNYQGAAQSAMDAIPMVGPWAHQIESDVANKGAVAGLAGLGTDVLAAKGMSEVPGQVGKVAANLNERYGGYTSPVIPADLQAASKVAESVRPAQGIKSELEENMRQQIPNIMDYARRNANPLHSQWEFAQAAKGAAQERLDHFNQNILGPHADINVPRSEVPTYSGPATGDAVSLGDINDRIGAINDRIRAAKRTANTPGAIMSAEEMTGLDDEAANLRHTLAQKLGERTGIDPQDISKFRQSYGQQFAIADVVDAARRSRLGQTGAQAEAGHGIALNKTTLVDKAITGLRGGQQYLADANFRSAMKPFNPAGQSFPQPVAPDPAVEYANRAAAMQEFLHQNALQQAAQDAVSQRGQMARTFRDSLVDRNQAAAQGEFLHQNALQQAAQDMANARSQATSQYRGASKQIYGDTMRTLSRNNAAQRALSGQ